MWSIRLFKTRSAAASHIRDGKVEVDGVTAKPSREVKVGDRIRTKRGATFTLHAVSALPKSRVGPKLVDDYTQNITPQEERDKAEMIRESQSKQLFTQGRPTKKSRREISKWMRK